MNLYNCEAEGLMAAKMTFLLCRRWDPFQNAEPIFKLHQGVEELQVKDQYVILVA